MLRFALFLIRVQWIDRRATSAFLIGITIQTALLSLAVFQRAETASEALELATRAALLTCTGIVLLSAMSNVQNEFRYGTMERLLLGVVPFFRLLLVRSGAAAVVSSPAVVIPFIAACAKKPELVGVHTILVIILIYVSLAAIGFQATLLLCQFRAPVGVVPWLRLLFLFVGLAVVPYPGSDIASLALAPGWILKLIDDQNLRSVLLDIGGFLISVVAWTWALWLILRSAVSTRIERNLTQGSEVT